MDVWVFDTHNVDIIKERVINNIKSMGLRALSNRPRMWQRYLLYYVDDDRMTHSAEPRSAREEATNIFYDCAWMEEDEVVEEIRGNTAEWVTWDSAVTTTPVDLSNYAQYFTVTTTI